MKVVNYTSLETLKTEALSKGMAVMESKTAYQFGIYVCGKRFRGEKVCTELHILNK